MIVHCTSYIVHCTSYNVHDCTLYIVHCVHNNILFVQFIFNKFCVQYMNILKGNFIFTGAETSYQNAFFVTVRTAISSQSYHIPHINTENYQNQYYRSNITNLTCSSHTSKKDWPTWREVQILDLDMSNLLSTVHVYFTSTVIFLLFCSSFLSSFFPYRLKIW